MPRYAIPLAAAFLLCGILIIGALFFSTGPTKDNPHSPYDTPANATQR